MNGVEGRVRANDGAIMGLEELAILRADLCCLGSIFITLEFLPI